MLQKHKSTLAFLERKIEATVDANTGEKCYDVYVEVLNSKDIGRVPQSRERLYIVAIKPNGRNSTHFERPGIVPALSLGIIYDAPRLPTVDYSAYPLDMFGPMVQARI